MLQKSETIQPKTSITETAKQAGIILMTAAATLGIVELPDHYNNRVILSQPAMVLASQQGADNNPIRREREDSPQHFVSYSIAQRTPGRYSKL